MIFRNRQDRFPGLGFGVGAPRVDALNHRVRVKALGMNGETGYQPAVDVGAAAYRSQQSLNRRTLQIDQQTFANEKRRLNRVMPMLRQPIRGILTREVSRDQA